MASTTPTDHALSAAWLTVKSTAAPVLLASDSPEDIKQQWVSVFAEYAQDTAVRGDVAASTLRRKFLLEYTSQHDPEEVNLRAQRDIVVMRLVVEEWEGGGAPTECSTALHEHLDGWRRSGFGSRGITIP